MSKSFEARPLTGSVIFDGLAPTLRVYGDLPEGHPFYANVGLVASEWAHAEHILDLTIWELAGIEPSRGACITSAIMGIAGRCRVIAALAGIGGLPDDLIKRVRSLMGDSHHVSDLRARIVHDPWYIETSADKVGQFKSMASSDPRYGIQDVSQDEVDRTLAKIRKLKSVAADLHRDFQDVLAESRKERP